MLQPTLCNEMTSVARSDAHVSKDPSRQIQNVTNRPSHVTVQEDRPCPLKNQTNWKKTKSTRARHSVGGATRNVTLSCLGLDLQNSWQIYIHRKARLAWLASDLFPSPILLLLVAFSLELCSRLCPRSSYFLPRLAPSKHRRSQSPRSALAQGRRCSTMYSTLRRLTSTRSTISRASRHTSTRQWLGHSGGRVDVQWHPFVFPLQRLIPRLCGTRLQARC